MNLVKDVCVSDESKDVSSPYNTNEKHIKSPYSKGFYEFIDNFGTTLGVIPKDKLKDINHYLNDISKKNKKTVKLDQETVANINDIVFTLNKLKEKGIVNSKSYQNKVRNYKTFVKNALEEYGVSISSYIPFSNPTELFIQINVLLSRAGLDKEQILNFYDLFNLRKRRPEQVKVEAIMNKEVLNMFLEDFHRNLTENDYFLLDCQVKGIALDNQLKEHLEKHGQPVNFEFSEQYYELLDNYFLDNMPMKVIPAVFVNQTSSVHQAIEISRIKHEYDKEKIQLEHLFLDYPMSLLTVPKFIGKQDFKFLQYAVNQYDLSSYHLHSNIKNPSTKK